MGISTTVIRAAGHAAWVQCDDCPAKGPRIDHPDRATARKKAIKAACGLDDGSPAITIMPPEED